MIEKRQKKRVLVFKPPQQHPQCQAGFLTSRQVQLKHHTTSTGFLSIPVIQTQFFNINITLICSSFSSVSKLTTATHSNTSAALLSLYPADQTKWTQPPLSCSFQNKSEMQFLTCLHKHTHTAFLFPSSTIQPKKNASTFKHLLLGNH